MNEDTEEPGDDDDEECVIIIISPDHRQNVEFIYY